MKTELIVANNLMHYLRAKYDKITIQYLHLWGSVNGYISQIGD